MSEEYIILGVFIVCAIMAAFKRNSFGAGNHVETKKKPTLSELEKEKMKQGLEDEMAAYALEEHEKELVRKDEFNVWDFDTEEPYEDDDYYKEDV